MFSSRKDEGDKLRRIQQGLGDILECGICLSPFDDPRMLPCVHSFCLGCLERSFAAQDPGESCSSFAQPCCPLCRRAFDMPSNGFAGLQKNFFLARLIETMRIVGPDPGGAPCESCLKDPTPGVDTPLAVIYCHTCKEKLCSACCFYHRKKKHQMTVIGEPGTDNSQPLDTSVPAYYCAQHNKYVLDLYCSDCDEVLCPMCFIEKHQGHQRQGIEEASIEFREQIESSVTNLLKVQTMFRGCCQRLEQQKSQVLEKTVDLERAVISAQEEVKKSVDQCANGLLAMISDTKAEALKRITTQLDDNNFKLASLDNYVLYSQGISQKGSDVDVCRAGNGLRSRYAEIQQMQINDGSEPIPILKKVFEKTELATFLSTHETSIIGTLEDKDAIVKTSSTSELETEFSEATEDEELSQALSSDWFLKSGSLDRNAAASNPQFIRVLETSISASDRKEIQGVAVLKEDLFIVHDRCSEIEAYDVATFNKILTLKINNLVDPGDIVASEESSCLYVVDWKDSDRDNEIMKVSPKGVVMKRWATPNDYSWLSVTSKNDVIMTLLAGNKIHEYNQNGKLITVVKISHLTGISKIWHAIKLSGGDFVVCHGVKGSQGVCRVDPNGNMVNMFSGSRHEFRLLHSPVYLVEDWRGSIFVVDQYWRQVVWLNSALEFQKAVLSRSDQLCSPRRICFSGSRGLILVGDEKGKVLIFGML